MPLAVGGLGQAGQRVVVHAHGLAAGVFDAGQGSAHVVGDAVAVLQWIALAGLAVGCVIGVAVNLAAFIGGGEQIAYLVVGVGNAAARGVFLAQLVAVGVVGISPRLALRVGVLDQVAHAIEHVATLVPFGVDGLADVVLGVVLDLPDSIRGGGAVGFGAAFAGNAAHQALAVALVFRDPFVRGAYGMCRFDEVTYRVVLVLGLEPQFVRYFRLAQVLGGVAGLAHRAVWQGDFGDLVVFVAYGAGGVATCVGADLGSGTGVVAHRGLHLAVDGALHQFAHTVVREGFHAAACRGFRADDLADELFVDVVVVKLVVRHPAVCSDALFDEVALVDDALNAPFLIGDLVDAVGDVVAVFDGMATRVGDVGEAVAVVVFVFDAARGQVAFQARYGLVAQFRQQLPGVVQGLQHASAAVHHGHQATRAVALQPDGVVVAVARGHHLALGVVIHPVAVFRGLSEALGVGLGLDVDLACAGRTTRWGYQHLHGLFFQNGAVVERVASVVAQVQLVAQAQGFGIHHTKAAAHAKGGVVQAHPNTGWVVVLAAAAVSHDPVERGGADGRHGLHLHHAIHHHGLGDTSNGDHLGRGFPVFVNPDPAARLAATRGAAQRPCGVCGVAARHVLPGARHTVPLAAVLPVLSVPVRACADTSTSRTAGVAGARAARATSTTTARKGQRRALGRHVAVGQRDLCALRAR